MKKYKDIHSLIRETTQDEDFASEVKKEAESRKLSTHLLALRLRNGMSQVDIAKKMKCSQGKISKIENSLDKELKFEDILNYCTSLGLGLNLGFMDANTTSVDMVKYHVLQAKKYLMKLASLAGDDEKMWEGISKFFGEAGFNMLLTIFEGKAVLGKHRRKKRMLLHISSPIESEETEKESKQVVRKK